jgi:hypothetical protein
VLLVTQIVRRRDLVADFICNWLGNKAWALSLDWAGKDGFVAADDAAWLVGGEEKGKVRSSGPFTFLQVYQAGHMVSDNARVGLLRAVRGVSFWWIEACDGLDLSWDMVVVALVLTVCCVVLLPSGADGPAGRVAGHAQHLPRTPALLNPPHHKGFGDRRIQIHRHSGTAR